MDISRIKICPPASIQTCDGVNGWQPCDASSYGPNYEVTETSCDNLDNDCDGLVDEDGVCCAGFKESCVDDGDCCEGLTCSCTQ